MNKQKKLTDRFTKKKKFTIRPGALTSREHIARLTAKYDLDLEKGNQPIPELNKKETSKTMEKIKKIKVQQFEFHGIQNKI